VVGHEPAVLHVEDDGHGLGAERRGGGGTAPIGDGVAGARHGRGDGGGDTEAEEKLH